MDYIDRELLKNSILDDMVKAEREGKSTHEYAETLFHLKTLPIADVVPRSEVEEIFDKYGNYDFPTEPKEDFNNTVETSNWLIKHYTDEQLVKMKGQAIREAIEELEQQAKQEVARELGVILAKYNSGCYGEVTLLNKLAELKKKYIGE